MELFQRKIKPGSNLSGIQTDRLLREYVKHADAIAHLSYLNQRAEFATPENPVQVSADEMFGSLNGVMIHAEIAQELERRGITPPD